MTTIPGHNQILQQSSIAQELSNQGAAHKPSPDQAVVQQQAQEIVQGSTVQGSEESERLKKQKEKKSQERKKTADTKKKKINRDEEMALDPDARGRLLDTTV
jgi:hypothetical protein